MSARSRSGRVKRSPTVEDGAAADDPCRRCRKKSHQGQGRHALSASGLTHDAERLALRRPRNDTSSTTLMSLAAHHQAHGRFSTFSSARSSLRAPVRPALPSIVERGAPDEVMRWEIPRWLQTRIARPRRARRRPAMCVRSSEERLRGPPPDDRASQFRPLLRRETADSARECAAAHCTERTIVV